MLSSTLPKILREWTTRYFATLFLPEDIAAVNFVFFETFVRRYENRHALSQSL